MRADLRLGTFGTILDSIAVSFANIVRQGVIQSTIQTYLKRSIAAETIFQPTVVNTDGLFRISFLKCIICIAFRTDIHSIALSTVRYIASWLTGVIYQGIVAMTRVASPCAGRTANTVLYSTVGSAVGSRIAVDTFDKGEVDRTLFAYVDT